MRVNVKVDIGEKTTCAVGILFIILATGITGSSTTTSSSTGTTTPLTATSKCIKSTSPIQYILGAVKHLLLLDFRRADWPTVWGSVQGCCGIFSFIISGTGKWETVCSVEV